MICTETAIQTRTKDPFRVQGVGIGFQRSPSQNRNQASRLKALNPNCLTHSSSQIAGRFLKGSTGTGFASFATRKVPKDLLTHLQSSGIYSQDQREEDIARWSRKVQLHWERVRLEQRDAAAPAIPVVREETEEQRARLTELYWDKLDEVTHDQFALVARVVSQAEIDRTPDAKAAMDKEWQKLVDKSCWLEKKVREYRDVAREAKAKEAKVDFGRIFEICSQKGSELPKGHPEQKWKGRSVFQGNKVSDENNDHAIFAELGSSPASMEAAKIIDVYGSHPNFSKQQADAHKPTRRPCFRALKLGLDCLGAQRVGRIRRLCMSSHVGSLRTSGLGGDLGESLCLAVGGQWLGSSSS